MRRAIDAGEQRRIDRPRNRSAEAGNIGAEIGGRLHLEREEASVAVEAELSARHVGAALRVGEKRFLAPRDPLHRAAQPARGPDHDRLLGIVLALVAEAAAHVLRYDAQPAFVDAELLADVAADVMRRLRAAIKRVAGRDAAARLDRGTAQAVFYQLHAPPMPPPLPTALPPHRLAAPPP